jgi:hypothetical protein
VAFGSAASLVQMVESVFVAAKIGVGDAKTMVGVDEGSGSRDMGGGVVEFGGPLFIVQGST